jgi:hypothetical protein
MKGDFSRFTFDPLNNYVSVLKQQGRVALDADWNEQASIWAEHFRRLAADILGEFAIPLASNDMIVDNSGALAISHLAVGPGGVLDFNIGRGVAYVGGFPITFPKDMTYRSQPDLPEPDSLPERGDILVFIESWSRILTYVDDELIREPALGGPDTCLRQRIIGQVKAITSDGVKSPEEAASFLRETFHATSLALTLQIDQSSHQIPISFGEIEPGGAIPGNLHYRIETHRGVREKGEPEEGFKWSDENGAIVAPIIRAIDSRTLLADESEEVAGGSFEPGDWVELANVITELHLTGGQMARIEKLESAEGGLTVTLDREVYPLLARKKNGALSGVEGGLRPRIRRWSGYFSPIAPKHVYDLGRGIKVVFSSSEKKPRLEPGDYWTYAIRDREYNKRHAPQKSPPNGIRKNRFPLAVIIRNEKGTAKEIIDCRRFFKPLS